MVFLDLTAGSQLRRALELLGISPWLLWKGYPEPKYGSLSLLALALDLPVQLLHNHLRYGESETHPAPVDIAGLREAPEKPE